MLVQLTPVQTSQTWLYVGHHTKVRNEWEDTWQNNILWEEDRSGEWIVEDQFVQLAQLSIENDILGLGLYIKNQQFHRPPACLPNFLILLSINLHSKQQKVLYAICHCWVALAISDSQYINGWPAMPDLESNA